MPCFADITRPETFSTKKDTTVGWMKPCQIAYQVLKESLMKEPILRYPDPKKCYVLFTVASKYAWVCAFTQFGVHEIDRNKVEILHPITYMSSLFITW